MRMTTSQKHQCGQQYLRSEFHPPRPLCPKDGGGERVDYRPRDSTARLLMVAESVFIFQEADCYLVARIERVAASTNVEFQK